MVLSPKCINVLSRENMSSKTDPVIEKSSHFLKNTISNNNEDNEIQLLGFDDADCVRDDVLDLDHDN